MSCWQSSIKHWSIDFFPPNEKAFSAMQPVYRIFPISLYKIYTINVNPDQTAPEQKFHKGNAIHLCDYFRIHIYITCKSEQRNAIGIHTFFFLMDAQLFFLILFDFFSCLCWAFEKYCSG